MRLSPALLVLALGCSKGKDAAPTGDTGLLVDSELIEVEAEDSEESELPDDTPEPSPEPEPELDTPPPVGAACYPGADWSYTTCEDTVDHSTTWGSAYGYPSPLGGSLQYEAPDRYIDLALADPSLRVAPNFVLDEFLQQSKGRFGVLQVKLVEHLQGIRDVIGPINITSGYRNVSYNAGVGGATHSRHMFGDAADFQSSSATVATLGSECEARSAGYVGYYEFHIHCDWRHEANDPSFFDGGQSPPPPMSQHAWLEPFAGGWRAPAEGWDEGEPLREWKAFDSDGELLEEATGRTYTPPPGAAEVEVVVGRAVTQRMGL